MKARVFFEGDKSADQNPAVVVVFESIDALAIALGYADAEDMRVALPGQTISEIVEGIWG